MDDTMLLRRAVDETSRLVDGVRTDQLDQSTPCDEFTVGQLLEHLVGGTTMMADHLGGTSAKDASFKAAAERLVQAAEAPGALDRTITLPYGEYPGTIVLQQALGEIAIHACDLARATGQAITDGEVYERVFDVVGDEWRADGVLGPARPCADDAPLIDRVLAFAGRKV